MNNKLNKLFGLLTILLVLLSSQPIKTVNAVDYISTDEEWSGYNFPDQDIVIQSGGSLTILSGATVLFDCSDAGNVGHDSDRIEIIVESGGTLNIDEAMMAGTGYPSDNCWYGIEYEPGSSGHVRDSYIRDAMKAVYVRSEVEVSGNTIDNMYGMAGSADDPENPSGGGSAWGVVIDVASDEFPQIANNEIRNIYGGLGVSGAVGFPSSAGGAAYGIYVYGGAPIISGNDIHIVYGGDGGDGGDGADGANGDNAIGPGAAGESGSPGEIGLNGSLGGIAAGIYLLNAQGAAVTGNEIYTIHSGDGGDGGNGGKGGDGGNGGGGVVDTNGGAGGAGGEGGAGGAGVPSRQVYGIYDTADASEISQNYIHYIQSGIPGEGGVGGDGGLGGTGGTGGDGTVVGGDGGQGGAGGNAGVGGVGGNAGAAYCYRVEYGNLTVFDKNKCSDANGRYGNLGGLGGSGGDGGLGGTAGGGEAKGNGGAGGPGGNGAAGGEGGEGGMVWGIYLHELIGTPDAITNNIINEMQSGLGGYAGNGGDGGMGGDGGPGTIYGAGGDGGDAGGGGDGGNTAGSIIAFVWDTDINIVNNTFYLPYTETYGGGGGTAGTPGLGGTGSSSGTAGSAGVDGSDGSDNDAIGLTALGEITVNIINNIFNGTSATNTVGLYESSSATTFNVEYNDFWNWTQDYYFPMTGSPDTWANNIDQNPYFVNAAVYDFHLTSESACIDAGDNSATGVPGDDFEGNTRPIDGDNNGSSIVDMGAYEIESSLNIFLPIFLK